MKMVYLKRQPSSDEGTLGKLLTEGFSAVTIELPWRKNISNLSCIPAGEYQTVIRKSNKFGIVYWVLKVEGRSYILIHSGNFAGNTEKGFKTHSHGCIIIGKYTGKLEGQKAVLLSKSTLRSFVNFMRKEPFTLIIKGVEDV